MTSNDADVNDEKVCYPVGVQVEEFNLQTTNLDVSHNSGISLGKQRKSAQCNNYVHVSFFTDVLQGVVMKIVKDKCIAMNGDLA